jgi:hypothetical protein
MRGRMLVSDMEAQPVLRVERKKETPRSDHTKLLTLFSLLNVFVGLYFLFFKVYYSYNHVNIALEFLY